MAKAYGVDWNETALADLLDGMDGPVWQLVNELSIEAAAIARTLVPIRRGGDVWSSRSTAAAIGYTLSTITAHMGYNNEGHIYGGVNAAAIPTIFLEYPRVSRRRQPFLTDSLWALERAL